jgi:hypothetical protein
MLCAWKPKISCASSDDFSALAKRFLLNAMPDRPPGSRACGSFAVPSFHTKSFLFVKERVEMDINGCSIARLQKSGENG